VRLARAAVAQQQYVLAAGEELARAQFTPGSCSATGCQEVELSWSGRPGLRLRMGVPLPALASSNSSSVMRASSVDSPPAHRALVGRNLVILARMVGSRSSSVMIQQQRGVSAYDGRLVADVSAAHAHTSASSVM